MKRLPLVVLILLIPVHSLSSARYHTRTTTYGCVDPAALYASTLEARSRGRCFRATPHETWERIARRHHSLLLLRIKPPHIGEPPLYFRRSSMVLVHVHHRRFRHHPHPATTTAALPSPVLVPGTAAIAPPLVALPAAPPPLTTAPSVAPVLQTPLPAPAPAAAPNHAAENTQPHAPTALPKAASPALSGTTTTNPAVPHPPTQQAPIPQPTHHSRHLLWPLLLWAIIIGFAGLLVQILLRRDPEPTTQAARREPTAAPGASIWEPAAATALGLAEKPAPFEPPAAAPIQEPEAASGPMVAEPSAANAPISLSDYKNNCVARLRHAGWDARTRFTGGQRGPDVIARHNGLVLALQCHLSANPVDVEAVEDACLVRERQRTDLAAIVSNASYTEAARQLAARTGIVLLHEDQLASFAA